DKYFNVFGVIWAYNLDKNSGLSVNEKDIKIFFKDQTQGDQTQGDQTQELANFINGYIKFPIEEEEVNRFLQGKYTQSQRLFELIKNNCNNLINNIYNTLAAKGYAPSDEQIQLVEEILRKVAETRNSENQNQKYAFFISGGPGSGKTYLAILLLLKSLSSGYKSIIFYRNNRLVYTL
ncbi:MAG: DNA/RNA helicase domain-containing protein, partial [bacterium]